MVDWLFSNEQSENFLWHINLFFSFFFPGIAFTHELFYHRLYTTVCISYIIYIYFIYSEYKIVYAHIYTGIIAVVYTLKSSFCAWILNRAFFFPFTYTFCSKNRNKKFSHLFIQYIFNYIGSFYYHIKE